MTVDSEILQNQKLSRKGKKKEEQKLYKPGMLKQKEQLAKADITSISRTSMVSSSPISEEDLLARQDEAAVLQSIYPDLFFQESQTRVILSFERDIRLTIDFPFDYPSRSPPTFELSGPNFQADERITLINALNEEYFKNLGSPILFTWITIINEFLQTHTTEELLEPSVVPTCSTLTAAEDKFLSFDIKHGEVLTDRKSHFQAHLCKISSKEEVGQVMRQLLQNNKIARATHNIYAYRIRQEKHGKQFILHDCVDDGEDGASSKMLEILDKMDAKNVIVIVTRWYGGIHLGPDRFRIINNLTREIALQYGYGKG